MNKFTQMEGLTNKVEIIVPSTVNVNEHIDNSDMVEQVLTELSLLFGGASAFDQQGGWVSDEHGLVKELSTVVYAYASDLNDTLLNNVYDIAQSLCDIMKQEAIAVTINGTMYFVEQSK